MPENEPNQDELPTPGISPDFYETLGLQLNTEQGKAYTGVAEMISKHCKSPRMAIDYGCGAGRSTRFLQKRVSQGVVGVDINEAMLEKANQKQIPGISYMQIESATLPYSAELFDLSFSGLVFLEISDADDILDILKEMKRVTVKDGIVIILTCTKAGYVIDTDSFTCQLSDEQKENLRDGDPVPTGIRDTGEVFTDYYWSDTFFQRVCTEAGLTLIEEHIPTAPDQMRDPRYIVYVCKKA
jgi:ubiquinone/menaquinone biosynthesis C-methylase UbiE